MVVCSIEFNLNSVGVEVDNVQHHWSFFASLLDLRGRLSCAAQISLNLKNC